MAGESESERSGGEEAESEVEGEAGVNPKLTKGEHLKIKINFKKSIHLSSQIDHQLLYHLESYLH